MTKMILKKVTEIYQLLVEIHQMLTEMRAVDRSG